MSDINAYEYGLLQEQDNPAKEIKPTELPTRKINETRLTEIIKYISRNLSCYQECPFNNSCDYYRTDTVVACRSRWEKFFTTGE